VTNLNILIDRVCKIVLNCLSTTIKLKYKFQNFLFKIYKTDWPNIYTRNTHLSNFY